MAERLKQYLDKLKEYGGSDLHLSSGAQIHIRINGDLHILGKEKLTNEEMVEIAKKILPAGKYNELVKEEEFDCSYSLYDGRRFRVNFFYQVEGLSAVLRAIPNKILSLDELHLPPVVKNFADLNHGLVLITGVTGSGKSTTLAALIDRINQSRKKHIITIEDPIEYLHENKKSLVSQRAIGIHTHSFSNALRAALREDIDVVMVGELRDLETVEMAIRAANTGHLVFATLHTHDAKESINRIIGMFPNEEQDHIRMTLSFVLEGVVSQRLIDTVDGGRTLAVEVMVKTGRISELILENRDNEILEMIVRGKEIHGSQSFDQSLLDRYTQGIISKEEALKNASAPSDLKLMIENSMQESGEKKVSQEETVSEDFISLKSSSGEE
jgi:twitching motility protein PilT